VQVVLKATNEELCRNPEFPKITPRYLHIQAAHYQSKMVELWNFNDSKRGNALVADWEEFLPSSVFGWVAGRYFDDDRTDRILFSAVRSSKYIEGKRQLGRRDRAEHYRAIMRRDPYLPFQ